MTPPGRWFEFKGAVWIPDDMQPPLEWWPFMEWIASRPAGTAIADLSLIESKSA